ncbi:hypothetical protein [Planctobacterium marinum]|uniref:Uncharacterized protein n=1 Tax=Planctobacterium marinum TaxID=1631968 RepID=A0AA48KQT7_9ALTE|nr:hypothetical protein MACH26_09230 [Planctobacterium marinum]
MKNIIFGLLSREYAPKDTTYKKLRELTIAWSRYRYQGEIIEGATVDDIMAKACRTDARFCLIQAAGHIIDERWYLSNWDKQGFYDSIDALSQEDNFLVAAESNRPKTEALNTDCLLVNQEKYRELGKPAFTGNDSDISGDNWIAQSHENNLTLPTLGDNINHCRFYLDELEQPTQLLTSLFGQPLNHASFSFDEHSPQQRFIEKINSQINNAKNGVFLFNIENYGEIDPQHLAQPLEALFSVAAGFKPYRILLEKGFTQDTQVLFFDYSQSALDIKKHMIEHWDGEDFPGYIAQLFKTFCHPDVFYQLWDGTTPDNVDWSDITWMWQQELQKWGGAENFKAHWQVCRGLPHQFLCCDLLNNRQPLLNKLAEFKRSYLWWSNAFFTIYSHWHFDADVRKQHYIDWLQSLQSVAPNCEISGADHNNAAVNGLTVSEYVKQFESTSCDQLHPQQINKISMQF